MVSFYFLDIYDKYQTMIIGLISKVIKNGPEDRGSISCLVIPNTIKWYLMLPCLTHRIIR